MENKILTETEEEIQELNQINTPEELTTLINLVEANDIDTLKTKFNDRSELVNQALKEWKISGHKIMERKDKCLDDGTKVKQWKLPISYQKKIVQSSVAFLFGKAIKIKQESTGTDDVFAMLMDLRKSMRMPSKDQLNSRNMFSQTESAKLFIPYKKPGLTPEQLAKAGAVSLKCILLSRDKGDRLYTLFDGYQVLQAFGRGYDTKESDAEIEHFDVYTADNIYYCTKNGGAWAVKKEANLVGKIPVVYYNQDQTEWADVHPLIERREELTSKRADNNDYSGDAILVLEGEVVSLPDKKDTGKVVQLAEGGKASYLYPQMAIDLVKDEKEDLKELIHYLTDTPDLSMDKMATLGTTSGKALEMLFFGALLKAMDKHEYFQEMIDREISILKAYIGKIIDTSKASTAEKLEVSIEFGNPLPDNIADVINMLSTATGGKPIMSQKTAVAINPLVSDANAENQAIADEQISADNTLV